jgi:CheY-like chemotaxis protein
MVRTDPTRLRQVLVNLIGNAVKFTEQGKITVRVSSVAGAHEHTVLKVAVTDTGIGMNEEQMARLFRPFSQADSTMSRRFGGTGLGLSISQRLCQLMGGTIEVQSSPGQGSTFIATIDGGVLPASVMLTAAEQFEPAPAAPLPMVQPQSVIVPRSSGCKGRILYAEDGPDNQRLISFYLKKAGFELEIANNGKEALEHVEQARARGELFDLILMDMQMPEMSGYEATAELRRQGWAGPIMSLTAHAMVGDQEKCAAAGCDYHMTKPVNREALVELCTKLCGASAQRLAA